MNPQLTLDDLEQILTGLSDPEKITSMNQYNIGLFEKEVSQKAIQLCQEVLAMRDPEPFAFFDSLRREIYAAVQFHQFYQIVQDESKRQQLIDAVKKFYRLRYEEWILTERTRLMGMNITQMKGAEFKTYLEVIGILPPPWSK